MNRDKSLTLMMLVIAFLMGISTSNAQTLTDSQEIKPANRAVERINKKITASQRKAAAANLAAARAKVANKKLLNATLSDSSVMAPMTTPVPGGVPDYIGSPNWAYSPAIRKFVDTLPGLGPDAANNLGQYITVATPDTVTYPGSDYYEISVRQYTEKLHSDLPPTTLRGYVQTNKGTDKTGHNTIEPAPIHYMGPTIIAQKDRPVRIKFTNELPTGEGGKLFIPVDTTVMGAGMGPLDMPGMPGMREEYTQNRAVIHLHGGRTPWISDGTPHQWITPAGEETSYPKGVSVTNVPDMPDPGPGSQTYYFTNQQSARLMFYHDHSWGITRLNVLVGEAGGYIVRDQTEENLVNSGLIPTEEIPLIIQDKSFVDAQTVRTTDPTWNWGTGPIDPQTGYRVPKTGDLWYPHVYVPAQNPYDLSGANPYGRWHYGPWFWPPTTDIPYGPVPNPYYDPDNAPWQPPEIPGTPNPSMPGESFFDVAMVNGTAYPVLNVQPKAYRFRILNAANDRFWNLQMYVADSSVTSSDGRTNTEVKMVPAAATASFPDYWPTDGREGGVPDPATAGPDWIQIGTEGGFLPAPAIIKQRPIAWNNDPTTFNFGNVSDHSLLLGTAERADVVVDFSAYAGKTLILYNDAPAAFPALDARYDYYTGAPDLTETGGHETPLAGFSPNTRTVMQIKVADAPPAAAFNLAALKGAFKSTDTKPGVFASGQDPIIVAQKAYNETYNKSFPATWPLWGYSRIQDKSLSFKTLTGTTLTIPMQPKALHDEMGAAYDEYGRMSGKLGLELANTSALTQNFILQNYVDPPTEIIDESMTALSPMAGDGTQIWKITHNGVDTHTLHFHLFDVQLINRVGWDGAIRLPDDNELGWKDTIRVSPLEDTIVALRAVAPKMPFGIPDSKRPLNPAEPIGSTMGFTGIDPYTGEAFVEPVTNKIINFGWEYVWHCHLLSHEEMDMMRPISFNVARNLPAAPVLTAAQIGSAVHLNWTDGTPAEAFTTWGDPANEVGFRVERATITDGQHDAFSVIAYVPANQTQYIDSTALWNKQYLYRVVAFNAAGDSISLNTLTAQTAQMSAYPVPQARAAASDETIVSIEGVSVTGTFPSVSAFYVEQSNRLAGIRVESTDHPTVGQVGTVQGVVKTVDGERRVVQGIFIPSGETNLIKPVMMVIRDIGGGKLGLVPGMTGMKSMNNVGLLLKVSGKVVSQQAGSFIMSDGSGSLKVIVPDGVTVPLNGQTVIVTGNCSVEKSGSDLHPVLLARSQSDVESTTSSSYSNVVTDWNSISVNAIKTAGLVSTTAARALAMVHGAVYDSVNSISATGKTYRIAVPGMLGASKDAAAAAAAHRVLTGLFPAQATVLDAALAESLSKVADGQAKADGIALGQSVADDMLTWRSTDHSTDMMMFMGGTDPGQWRPTPPAYAMGMMPLWGTVTPFAMQSGSSFRLPNPPSLDSMEYALAVNETKSLGRMNSSARTADQTKIAYFWADSPGTITTVGRWNAVARDAAIARNLSTDDNARLFAILNISLADAGISVWDSKYYYALWRPITAIREAANDGNSMTEADPMWMPELMTPAFPEYASAHSTFSGAAAESLKRFFGTDSSVVSIPSFANPAERRSYGTFSQVADEAGISRIYGGIHFRFSDERGKGLGRNIAGYVCDNFFKPMPAKQLSVMQRSSK